MARFTDRATAFTPELCHYQCVAAVHLNYMFLACWHSYILFVLLLVDLFCDLQVFRQEPKLATPRAAVE